MSAYLRERARRQGPRLAARLRRREVPITLGHDVPREIEFRPEATAPPPAISRSNWRPLPHRKTSHMLGTIGLLAVSAFLAFGFPAIVVYRNAIAPAWIGDGSETRSARAERSREQGGDVAHSQVGNSTARDERLAPSDTNSGVGSTTTSETETARALESTSRQGSSQKPTATEERSSVGAAGNSAATPAQPSRGTIDRRDFSVPDLIPPARGSAQDARESPPRMAMSAEPKMSTRDAPQPPLAVQPPPRSSSSPTTTRSNTNAVPPAAVSVPPATNMTAADLDIRNRFGTSPRGHTPAAVPGGVLLQSSWLKLCKRLPGRIGIATDASVPCHITSYLVDDPSPALFAVSLTTRPDTVSTQLMLEFAQRATDIEVWADGDRVPLRFEVMQCSRASCAFAAQLDPAHGKLIARAPALRLVFRTPDRGAQSAILSTDGLADAFDGPAANDIDARERRSELSAAWVRAAYGGRTASASGARDRNRAPALFTGRI